VERAEYECGLNELKELKEKSKNISEHVEADAA
jgi:hypothetical protein